jgi:hypothetical protein
MRKQIATATMEGTRKRGKPRKRWRNEVHDDLNIMGIKKQADNGQRSSGMEEDYIGATVQKGLYSLAWRREDN